jgi:hypothetical protein
MPSLCPLALASYTVDGVRAPDREEETSRHHTAIGGAPMSYISNPGWATQLVHRPDCRHQDSDKSVRIGASSNPSEP